MKSSGHSRRELPGACCIEERVVRKSPPLATVPLKQASSYGCGVGMKLLSISPVRHSPSAAAQETNDVHHTSSAWAGSLLDLFSRAFFSPRRFLTCISQLRSSFGKLAFGQGWLGNSASRRCPELESQRHVCALTVRGAGRIYFVSTATNKHCDCLRLGPCWTQMSLPSDESIYNLIPRNVTPEPRPPRLSSLVCSLSLRQ